MRLAVAEQRRAQPYAELAVFRGVHPSHRARVPAAIYPLELLDQFQGPSPRLAADSRSRVQEAGELDRAVGFGELGVDRRRQMLEVADLDDERLALGVDPDRVRAEGPLDAPHDDPMLISDLRAAQHRLPEVVIDGGVRAARGGPRERDGGGHRP